MKRSISKSEIPKGCIVCHQCSGTGYHTDGKKCVPCHTKGYMTPIEAENDNLYRLRKKAEYKRELKELESEEEIVASLSDEDIESLKETINNLRATRKVLAEEIMRLKSLLPEDVED